jgi:hypothetical protein
MSFRLGRRSLAIVGKDAGGCVGNNNLTVTKPHDELLPACGTFTNLTNRAKTGG